MSAARQRVSAGGRDGAQPRARGGTGAIAMPWQDSTWQQLREHIETPAPTLLKYDNKIVRVSGARIGPTRVAQRLERYWQTGGMYASEIVLGTILPAIDDLVLRARDVLRNTHLMRLPARATASISLSRPEIACILALMWYDLLGDPPDIENYWRPTLLGVWRSESNFALDCMFTYFLRARDYGDTSTVAHERVVYRRYVHDADSPLLQQQHGSARFEPILAGDGVDLDNSAAVVHICGCTDDCGAIFAAPVPSAFEQTLLSRPESCVGVLLWPRPSQYRVNVVIGAEQFMSIGGHGSTIRALPPHADAPLARGCGGMVRQCANVFAPPTPQTGCEAQYIKNFATDVEQLICACVSVPVAPGTPVAIGAWAYGPNGSPPRLRLIQAALACAVAERTLYYYTDDPDTVAQMGAFDAWLSEHTAGQLLDTYMREIEVEYDLCGLRISGTDLLAMVMNP